MRKYFDVVFLTTSIPAAGAYVYVLDGSGNRAPLFSDNGITSLPNPVTTDRTGFYSFYVADGTYTLQYVLGGITLRTLTAVQIYDESSASGVSNAIANGTATDAGMLTGAESLPLSRGAGLLQTTLTKIAQWVIGTYQGFTQSGVGSIGRTLLAKLLDLPVSILDFPGVDRTGATDSTAGIQAALNSGAMAVYVPPGTYLCGGLVMPQVVGFVLYGAGTASILKQKGGGAVLLGWSQTSIFYQQGYVRDLAFDGTNGANNTIDTTGVGGETFQNLYFNNTPTGFSSIYVNGAAGVYTHDMRFKNIEVYSNNAGFAGVRFGPLSSDQSVDDLIMNGNFQVQYCIYLDSGASTLRVSNSHPYNAAVNVLYAAGSNTSCSFNGVTLDNAIGDVAVVNGSTGWKFTDVYFEAVKSGKNGLTLNNTNSVSLFNCQWDAAVGAGSAVVETGTANDTKIYGGSIGTLANYSSVFSLIGSRSFATAISGYNSLGQFFSFSGATTSAQAQATTMYLGINGANSNVNNTAYVVPQNALLQKVFIATTATPAAGQTFTFNVMDGATVLGTGVVSNGSFGVTLTLNKSVTQYDQISIQSVFSATSGSANVRYTATFAA